mmetsp:Transcript_10250/g.15147  ORF Transcript_10250/g.15147 Transcript_10250/m.15147 type:complete len:98 (+) Transcript_10250:110-403(+)
MMNRPMNLLIVLLSLLSAVQSIEKNNAVVKITQKLHPVSQKLRGNLSRRLDGDDAAANDDAANDDAANDDAANDDAAANDDGDADADADAEVIPFLA